MSVKENMIHHELDRMVIVYVYAPLLDCLFGRIVPACMVLILILCADLIYSGRSPNLGNGIARCQ